MNKVRNRINRVGYYQGTPVAEIVLTEEPSLEWLEDLPRYLNHSHICINGEDCMAWDLDPLFTTIYQNTILSYIQVITNGNKLFVGSLRPDWLTIVYTEEVLAVHPKEINELVLLVDDKLVWQLVEDIAERISNFELVVSFVPVSEEYQWHAMAMVLKYDQFLNGYGQSKYVVPIEGGASNPING